MGTDLQCCPLSNKGSVKELSDRSVTLQGVKSRVRDIPLCTQAQGSKVSVTEREIDSAVERDIK